MMELEDHHLSPRPMSDFDEFDRSWQYATVPATGDLKGNEEGYAR